MRISRRVSGGRGEYEMSGEAAQGLRPTDLLGLRLILDLGEGWFIDTDTQLTQQGGKPRIRRIHGTHAYIQVQRQLAAALLMPHPARQDSSLAGGQPILRAGKYAIEHVELSDHIVYDEESATLILMEIVLRNMSNHAENLHFDGRKARLQQVWTRSAELPAPINELLVHHRQLVQNGGPVMEGAEDLVEALQNQVTELAEDLGVVYRGADSDVLEDLEHALSIAEAPPAPPVHMNEIDPDETQVRRRVLKDWKRWANARGAASANFRHAVREAYRSTCIICGIHLPATSMNAVPGVDAAHILPWADFDLDVVSNGLCLCKLHHWAFDEGLIVIEVNEGQYTVVIPGEVADAIVADNPQFSIDSLLQHAGSIPEQRLPHDPHRRPNPTFLQMLSEA